MAGSEHLRNFSAKRPAAEFACATRDRLGDDVAESLMSGTRVQAEEHGGLFVVRFDSTGAHNRRLFDSHGQMEEDDMDAICSALDRAPSGALRLLLLHHHLLPLPDDHLFERVITQLGWPNAAELSRGREMVDRPPALFAVQ